MKNHPILRPFAIALRLLLVVFVVGIACPITTVQAQTPAPASETAPAKAAPSKKTLWETNKLGGWVMYLICIMSVFTIYIVIDIYLRTSNTRLVPEAELEKVRQLFMAGDYVNCYQAMKENPSAFSSCVKYGLSFVGKGKEQTEEALLVEVNRENNRLQNIINYLSVIGVCAPMVGLVGTVVGMMGAFSALGEAGSGDTSALSEAIGHVLVATASGLIVAIPAFMFFYMLRNRLTAKMHWLEDQVTGIFRNMPYEHFHGLEIGEELTFAALPNWVEADPNASPAQ